jgi:hypothetical protein
MSQRAAIDRQAFVFQFNDAGVAFIEQHLPDKYPVLGHSLMFCVQLRKNKDVECNLIPGPDKLGLRQIHVFLEDLLNTRASHRNHS